MWLCTWNASQEKGGRIDIKMAPKTTSAHDERDLQAMMDRLAAGHKEHMASTWLAAENEERMAVVCIGKTSLNSDSNEIVLGYSDTYGTQHAHAHPSSG